MDDEQSRPDQSRPTEPTPLGGEELDPATLEALQHALRDLDFLRPDVPEGDNAEHEAPMPEWAWQRITVALDAERGVPTARSRGWNRWAGGLVAASVALVAVGFAVTSLSGGSGGGALVLSEATASASARTTPAAAAAPGVLALPDALSASEAPAEALTAAASEADAAPATGLQALPADLSIPGMLSFAGMVPPAATVLDSQTDYSTPELENQVAGVLGGMDLEGMDMTMPRMKAAAEEPAAQIDIPLVPASAVQQASQSLRDCITRLTQLADSTALLVDWSRVDGQDAGVVVVPEYAGPDQTTADLHELDIWVIDPECDVRVEVHMSMP